jgi:hypothetical protein
MPGPIDFTELEYRDCHIKSYERICIYNYYLILWKEQHFVKQFVKICINMTHYFQYIVSI